MKPFQKEISLPSLHFQVITMLVSGRVFDTEPFWFSCHFGGVFTKSWSNKLPQSFPSEDVRDHPVIGKIWQMPSGTLTWLAGISLCSIRKYRIHLHLVHFPACYCFMEEILHQLRERWFIPIIYKVFFIHPRWLFGISSINSMLVCWSISLMI